jgi:hypothetical protein
VADQIRHLARSHYEPLTKLCGVNLLTAGILAGMLGPAFRDRSPARRLRRHVAAGGVVSWSGLNRGGNRRLNSVVYRVALTQAHFLAQARAHIERRISEGKSRREAHRCLRRYIVRAIWRLWRECSRPQATKNAEAA